MTDRQTLYDGASCAAWGYLFLFFDFNLGTVSVLPRFVGYLLLLSAIGKLSGARRDLALLQPLGLLLAVWYGADWLLSWGGGTMDGKSLFLDLLASAAGLYFRFQFLTDAAALAAQYQGPEDRVDNTLLQCRTIQTVFVAAAILTGSALTVWPELRDWTAFTVLALGGTLISVLAGLLALIGMFSLRKLFREDTPAAFPPGSPGSPE